MAEYQIDCLAGILVKVNNMVDPTFNLCSVSIIIGWYIDSLLN